MSTDFDHYKLQYKPEWRMDHQIGIGGFGAVYKEQIRRPGVFRSEVCAVKKIHAGAVNLTGHLPRYKREIAILASLVHHEWFVQFFGWYETEDSVFIAMEYMELGDLNGHLGEPWAENDTKIVAQQLLKGLAVLHKVGITHRDLKPQNIFPILVDNRCLRIKIGDFGVSKSVTPNANTHLRTQIHVHGYTPPEVIGNPASYTNAVDLWSLGCLIYRLVCGEELFDSVDGVCRYKYNLWSFPRARLSRQGLCQSGIDFIESLVQRDPQHRPTAADALNCNWIHSTPLAYKLSSTQVERFQNHIQQQGKISTIENAANMLPQQQGPEEIGLDHSSSYSRRGNPDADISEIFSQYGERPVYASLHDAETKKLWDPSMGPCQQTLKGHSNWVRSVKFSPDGARLASGSSDNTVKLWDSSTGVCLMTLKGHSNGVSSVVFSPDGNRLASASEDRTIKLWDPSTGACQGTLKGHSSEISSVVFSPDGKRLGSGGNDDTAKVWDLSLGVCQATLTGHSSAISSVAFSPDGNRLASGAFNDMIKIWDPLNEICQHTLRTGTKCWLTSIAFSPDGGLIASASSDKAINLWDLSMGIRQRTLTGHSNVVSSVAFSSDGQRLASGSYDNTVRLWDRATGTCRTTLDGHSAPVKSVAFSPDGNRLASASNDNTVKIWDSTSEQIKGL